MKAVLRTGYSLTRWLSISQLLLTNFERSTSGIYSRLPMLDPTRAGSLSGFLKREGTFTSLGVEYPINPGDSTSLRDETAAHPVYSSYLDQESLCPSGQRSSLQVFLQPGGHMSVSSPSGPWNSAKNSISLCRGNSMSYQEHKDLSA